MKLSSKSGNIIPSLLTLLFPLEKKKKNTKLNLESSWPALQHQLFFHIYTWLMNISYWIPISSNFWYLKSYSGPQLNLNHPACLEGNRNSLLQHSWYGNYVMAWAFEQQEVPGRCQGFIHFVFILHSRLCMYWCIDSSQHSTSELEEAVRCPWSLERQRLRHSRGLAHTWWSRVELYSEGL